MRAKQAILDFIKSQLSRGELPDNKLPAEEELCQMLGVSRPTVREALMALDRDGIVSKKHGTGNLVHRSTLETRMRFDKFINFKELLEDKGYTVEVRFSPFKVPTREECEIIDDVGGCCEGSLYQENLYTADSVPAILAYNYPRCSMKACESLGEAAASGTFSAFLENLSGEMLAHTIVGIMPDVARGGIAARLGLASGVPLIKLKESHYSEFDHLLAESVVYFNPNVVDLTILRKW